MRTSRIRGTAELCPKDSSLGRRIFLGFVAASIPTAALAKAVPVEDSFFRALAAPVANLPQVSDGYHFISEEDLSTMLELAFFLGQADPETRATAMAMLRDRGEREGLI